MAAHRKPEFDIEREEDVLAMQMRHNRLKEIVVTEMLRLDLAIDAVRPLTRPDGIARQSLQYKLEDATWLLNFLNGVYDEDPNGFVVPADVSGD